MADHACGPTPSLEHLEHVASHSGSLTVVQLAPGATLVSACQLGLTNIIRRGQPDKDCDEVMPCI